jgi:hypothetical protein
MHYMRQRRRGDATITLKPGPKPGARASSPEQVEKLEQQDAVLRQESAALRRKVAQAGVADEELLRESILLRHEVVILKRQLAKAPAAEPNQEVARLRKRVRELQARLREVTDAPRGTGRIVARSCSPCIPTGEHQPAKSS